MIKKANCLFIISVLFTAYSSHAQTNCPGSELIGEWRKVRGFVGFYTNVDSLKKLITDSSRVVGTLTFKPDSTYDYTFLDIKSKCSRRFTFDRVQCQIILGLKRKARTHANLDVIYMDDKFLIIGEDNNPKGYFTHVLIKG